MRLGLENDCHSIEKGKRLSFDGKGNNDCHSIEKGKRLSFDGKGNNDGHSIEKGKRWSFDGKGKMMVIRWKKSKIRSESFLET
ncbi:MAG: hypothetical protein U9N51_01055 [Bacteroidota bacterium]|nr:hypothetical protein [Bacteroidota bacterium]